MYSNIWQESYHSAEVLYDSAGYTGKIFIGSIRATTDVDWLIQNDISVIINASDYDYVLNDEKIKLIPVHSFKFADDDFPSKEMFNKIIDYVSEAAEIIDENVTENKNVLVHCRAGMNRSALIIGSYLIAKYNNYDKALNSLKCANQTRSIDVLFNPYYRRVLAELENVNKCETNSNSDEIRLSLWEIISNLKHSKDLVSNLSSEENHKFGYIETPFCWRIWN